MGAVHSVNAQGSERSLLAKFLDPSGILLEEDPVDDVKVGLDEEDEGIVAALNAHDDNVAEKVVVGEETRREQLAVEVLKGRKESMKLSKELASKWGLDLSRLAYRPTDMDAMFGQNDSECSSHSSGSTHSKKFFSV